MKINLAKSAGFCFGVKRAIKIAHETASSGSAVYMLGDIVHNEDVTRQMREIGIKNIKRLGSGKNKIFLMRAHGSSKNIATKAKQLGYSLIDATCPMVKEIHRIAKDMEQKGYMIIVIGDRKHDEVHGITGQLKGKTLVIDSTKNIPYKSIKGIKKAAVVVQSTQNIDNVMKILNRLKPYTGELKFFNTICMPTTIKQREIKRLPKENDVMIIIGSKNSANTKRLYEISKSLNDRSYWVNSRNEIKRGWFKRASSVGVTAGASTPESTIKDIVKYLSKIS